MKFDLGDTKKKEPGEGKILCENCGAENEETNDYCWVCRQKLYKE